MNSCFLAWRSPSEMGSILNRKNLLLGKEGKMKLTELLPLKVYPFILSSDNKQHMGTVMNQVSVRTCTV